MKLKQASMTFKLNWLTNVYLLPLFSTSVAYFKLNWDFVCVWFYRVQRTCIIPIKMTWVVLFTSWTHLYHNQNRIQIFIFLPFLQVSMGHVHFSDPLYRGVPMNLFQFCFIIRGIVQSFFIFWKWGNK